MNRSKKEKMKKRPDYDTKISINSSNKELEDLVLTDVACPICLSVIIEPVTMPCNHSLCLHCFESNVSEANLFCPLCRKRISIWVRTMRKKETIVDVKLWKIIQSKFKDEIQARLRGEDESNSFSLDVPDRRLSCPGEIRKEYEVEVEKIRHEEEKRKKQEEELTTSFITKMQEQEEKRLNELMQERKKFYERDRIFAEKLREAQMKELKRKAERKISESNDEAYGPMDVFVIPSQSGVMCSTPKSQKRIITTGPIAAYASNPIPSSSQKSPTPKSQKRIITTSPIASCASNSMPSSSQKSPTSVSYRTLRDITAQHSSESESECDNEKNIKMSRKKRVRTEAAFSDASSKVFRKSDETTQSSDPVSKSVNAILEMLKSNQLEDDELQQIVDEQKALEARIRQEQEDLALARQLQKQFRSVDRSKGSEDEYCLRNHLNSTDQNPCSSNSKTKKYRQVTIMESLAKRQRRI